MTHFVILDRDGVINCESVDYVKSPEEWYPIPGSLEAMASASQAGLNILIATNQSGVARGYYSLETLHAIHQKMYHALHALNGKITDLIFCPHHPEEHCPCRKPNPGMLLSFQQKYQFNLAEVFFIGDSWVDFKAAENAGARFILVLTGSGKETVKKFKNPCNIPIFPNLAYALEFVMSSQQMQSTPCTN